MTPRQVRFVEQGVVEATLLPPIGAGCKECGSTHYPEEPHNAQSLYYQYAFYAAHGRWPTWKDAMAHCQPKVQRVWEEELRARGAWSEPDA